MGILPMWLGGFFGSSGSRVGEASQGVRFTQAISQSPVCTPSQGRVLTGRMPSALRLSRNGQACPEDLPQGFAAAGLNGLVDKLHLNNCDRRLACGPEW